MMRVCRCAVSCLRSLSLGDPAFYRDCAFYPSQRAWRSRSNCFPGEHYQDCVVNSVAWDRLSCARWSIIRCTLLCSTNSGSRPYTADFAQLPLTSLCAYGCGVPLSRAASALNTRLAPCFACTLCSQSVAFSWGSITPFGRAYQKAG